MADRESAAWREVDELIATKSPNNYDRAVDLLVDLRDLGERSGRTEEIAERTREIRKRHRNKPTLMERFKKQKLGI